MTEVDAAARTLWHFHAVSDPVAPADVIIGLGSYDLRVARRCAALYHAGMAERIIFSGAHGNWTEGLFAGSEAAAFAAEAIREGVPQTAVTLEEAATNIGDNIRFSARFMPNAKRIILVTKPQTQMRARATARKQWPAVFAMVTAPETAFEDQPLPHHDKRALICEMVGDVARMEDYAQRGFQAQVDVPQPVRAACDLLIAAGFTDHLPSTKV